jgi:hypothetical protein
VQNIDGKLDSAMHALDSEFESEMDEVEGHYDFE